MKRRQRTTVPFKSVIMVFLIFCLLSPALLVKADWKDDANARIEQIRKRNIKITLVNSLGQPVQDISVELDQTSHRFGFGTCIRYSPFSGNTAYRNFILNNFEWAVCENESKWAANEPSRDYETYSQSDTIYYWCRDNGIKMRGHTLFWEQWTYVQTWVKNLPYATYPTSSELLDEVRERIDSAMNRYKNKFLHWDVINEMLPTGSDYRFFNRLGDNGRVHIHQRANSIDPNCKLFMNEFTGNSFSTYYDAYSYINRYNTLRNLGAPIHGIGIQCHLAEETVFNPTNFYNYLQSLASGTGLPIWVSELDIPHTNITQRADNLENFFRICFSHPSVEGIIFWGFMQGQMWRNDAYLVNSSGTPNQAGLRYQSLRNEWTTNSAGITDTSGITNFRGFYGTYDIILSAYGQPTEIHTIELEPGAGTAEFTLLTNLRTPVPDYIPPEPNPMDWAALPSPTGAYTITMTASSTIDDSPPVYYYFECTSEPNKSSSWQTNPTFTARNLQPLTEYSFRIKAKDSYLTPNETEWSSIESATTYSPSTEVNLLGSWMTGLSHTKEPGIDRALVFIAHAEYIGTKSITSVTYGGQEMIKIMEEISDSMTIAYTAAFILPEYGVATAPDDNFVVTWSSAPTYDLYASAFFCGIDQTGPIGATAYNWTTEQTVSTSPLATNNNDMVILAATHGSAGSYVTNNSFTESTDQIVPTQMTGVTGYKTGIGIEETPSVTFTGSTSRQVIIGFVLKAPPYTDNPPAAPTGLTAMAGNETISLNWNDNNEPDLAGYNVYRSITQGSGYSKINSSVVINSDYIDSPVDNWTPYYYAVTAVDLAEQESDYSNETSAIADFQECSDVWEAGFGFLSDINKNCYVNMDDLLIIIQFWLHTDCSESQNCLGADLEPDGDVDIADYSIFAHQWLNCNDPTNLECVHNW